MSSLHRAYFIRYLLCPFYPRLLSVCTADFQTLPKILRKYPDHFKMIELVWSDP